MSRLAAAGASRTRVLTGKKMSLDTIDFGHMWVGVLLGVKLVFFCGGVVLRYAAELLCLQKLPTINTRNLFISLGVRVLVRGRVLCTILLCSEMERVDE
jgi:hypothetical protein